MTTPKTPKPWEHAKAGGSASDAVAARFVCSLGVDVRLYDADIRGSIAHARMLSAVGLITAHDLSEIERGLGEIRREIESAPAAWPGWKPELEDVHMCIEAALIEKVGEPGRKLHTGRSRNDQVALDLRLWLREAAAGLADAIDRLLGAFEGLAAREGEHVIPGYTHLQRAQPVCFGGELMAWYALLGSTLRWANRLADEEGRLDCPLGSGALAGSSLPIDRDATALSLGFDNPSPSSIASTASRDEALDYLYVVARAAMQLSRWAEQWIIYSSAEFAFITLDDAHTTGSSMMPQKRNPDMLELIRGRTGVAYGSLVGLLTVCKGITIGYNRDLQEDKRHLFAANDSIIDSLEMARRIVDGVRINPGGVARAAGGLDHGHLDATLAAEYLVTRGVAFRTAHQVVGGLVRRCDDLKLPALADLPRAEARQVASRYGLAESAIGDDFGDWLGAARGAGRYRSIGNAGPAGYLAALRAARARRGAPGDGPSSPDAIAPEPPAGLFGDEAEGEGPQKNAEESILIAYLTQGRTLDDLPYTPEFTRIHAAAGGMSERELFHWLHNRRKAGKLPTLGRSQAFSLALDPEEEHALASLVIEAVGTLGRRDQLPYTPAFDRIVEQIGGKTGRSLGPYEVWRLIAKIAK